MKAIGDVETKRKFTAVASESLSSGDPVCVKSNGTVAKAIYTGGSDGDLTTENFIGFSDADYSNGADASVLLSGSITREQSGLTAGQKYYVQADGTLGTTADDPSVVAGTAISATERIVKG